MSNKRELVAMQKKSKNKRGGGDQRFVNVFSY